MYSKIFIGPFGAAMLGQEGSLPFWLTIPCIFGFIIGGTALAIYRLNKRLDVP